MNEATFWSLIGRLDWSYEGEDELVIEPLIDELSTMPRAEIASFQDLMAEKLYALDGRAWARESGNLVWWGEPEDVSADGFLYARCVVVANGQEYYEAVLRDPKAMPKDVEFEILVYIGQAALKRQTGNELDELDQPRLSFETFSNRDAWRPE